MNNEVSTKQQLQKTREIAVCRTYFLHIWKWLCEIACFWHKYRGKHCALQKTREITAVCQTHFMLFKNLLKYPWTVAVAVLSPFYCALWSNWLARQTTDAQWSLFSLKSITFGLEQTKINTYFGPCFPLFNHYFYKKLYLYIHISNVYLGLGFEFWPQRIRDLAVVHGLLHFWVKWIRKI